MRLPSKKTRNITIIILGIIIVILILLPIVVKKYVVNNSKELLGRTIAINTLKYNYFTSTAKVYDFKMLEGNDTDTFVSFDTLEVNLAPLQLLNNTVVVEEFDLKGLKATIIKKDSLFNFDSLINFFATNDTIETETKTDPFKYDISALRLKNANVHFLDKDIEETIKLDNISFSIPNIRWDQKEKSDAKIAFDTGDGHIESELKIDPITSNYRAKITAQNIDLKPFYKYVLEYAEINSLEGKLDATINIDGETNASTSVIPLINGIAKVQNFKMTDTSDKTFLAANTITTGIEKIDYANSNYVINDIVLDGAYTFFQLNESSNNFFKIFKVEETTEVEQVQKDSITTIQYTINHLKVENSVLDYTDNLTGKPFNYHLSDIVIDTDNISSKMDKINLNATMTLNNRGNLVAKLGVNPNDYTRDFNLDIAVENFLLPDLNIYTNYYMGHNLIEGNMYYYSTTKIVDGALEVENKLKVKNAELKNTRKGLYHLPLKFAFFLLTDKDGEINMDIPVRGNLNDPQIKVGKIVWKAFSNLIVKTVSKPIKLLGNLIGGDPKDLEEIKFSYVDAIPTPKHYKQLDKLIKLENKKPGLSINLKYYVDEDLQKEALARAKMGEQFFKEYQKDYEKNLALFETFVNTKIGSDSLTVTQASLALVGRSYVDSVSTNYNKERIKYISEYLLKQSDATKIKIETITNNDPKHLGSKPRLQIEYGLSKDDPQD
ncbi:DUF748 domain-containing protein [Aquimarina rhabdastrellae]